MCLYIHCGIGVFALIAAHAARAADPEALLSQGDHYADVGNSVKAGPLYAQAELEFRARGDARREMYAKFGRLRREVETGSYFAVQEQVGMDLIKPVVQNDPALKIRGLALKGIIDLNVNTAAAQDDFSQIQSLAKAIGDRKWENRASGYLGLVAGVNGDVGGASVALLKAINTARALNDVAAEILFVTWLANGMSVHGMAQGALPLLDRALSVVAKDTDAGFPVQLYIAKIRALVLLPESAERSGPTEAKQLIAEALKYARANDILGAQCELLNQAGLLSLSAHDWTAAEAYFHQTADVARQANLPRMEAEGFLHLSEVYEQRKELTQAIAFIDSAIERVRFVQEDFVLPVHLARKAELEALRGNLGIADRLYSQASELIEAMLINAPSSHTKSSMIASLSDIYIGQFRLALLGFHDNAKAFCIIETARGRALADSIRHANRSGPTTSTSDPERQIASIQKRLRESPVSPAETKVLLTRLDQAYGQFARVDYERNRPEMRMLRRPPVSIPTLQGSLAPGEALIEYVLDNGRSSHALEITSTTVRAHEIPTRADVNNLSQSYVRALKAKGNWTEPGKALFDRVVLPALSTHPNSVIIVPDGSLHLVPFASLPDTTGHSWASSVVVSFAPSATVFELLRTGKRSTTPSRPFLGVAYSPGSSDNRSDEHATTRGLESAFAKLKPLPFARDEVQSAARVAGSGSVLLVDGGASESALKSQPLQDFKVIHLAMHGFGDVRDPDRAGLVLAPGDPKEDGLWQAREIRESRISADLVTLSACETGVGRLQGEEGIMNLARTFLIAGAKSVVASLWDVDDRSTATLMTRLYQQIANGKSVAEALRGAQLAMLAEFGSEMQPYYWAGFTVIGDGTRKIDFTKTKPTVAGAKSINIR